MRIAIYGATGVTGQLIAAELTNRGVETRLIGRDSNALKSLATEKAEVYVANLDSHDDLIEAFKGCVTVISCVAVYTQFGEQSWIKRVHQEYGPVATKAGVTLLPAATDDGFAGDLASSIVAKHVTNIDSLSIHHAYFNAVLSRGSMRSFLEFSRGRLEYWGDGAWQEGQPERQEDVDVKNGDGNQPAWLLAGPELVAIQRRIPARLIQATVNMDLVTMLSGVTEEDVTSTPRGPSVEVRATSRFTIVCEAKTVDGKTVRCFVRGSDIYKITAICAVEAALRISHSDVPTGTVAPSEIADPEQFLADLGQLGFTWELEN
nr:hypothetical protein CFP56_11508 [Quercus suber]